MMRDLMAAYYLVNSESKNESFFPFLARTRKLFFAFYSDISEDVVKAAWRALSCYTVYKVCSLCRHIGARAENGEKYRKWGEFAKEKYTELYDSVAEELRGGLTAAVALTNYYFNGIQ